MENINHYDANQEFRFLYSEFVERLMELEAYLLHGVGFVDDAQKKIGPGLELYSNDFFEYFYAGSYGYLFRSSFLVMLTAICEDFVKEYISYFKRVFSGGENDVKFGNNLLDTLKDSDREYKIGLDFNNTAIVEFKSLLAVRHSLVHSNGNTDYIPRYVPLIEQLARKYTNIQLCADGNLAFGSPFCRDALAICRKFSYYISKTAVRKFPHYLEDKPDEESL